MPIYTIKAPDGNIFRIKGNREPTQEELREIYAHIQQNKQKSSQTNENANTPQMPSQNAELNQEKYVPQTYLKNTGLTQEKYNAALNKAEKENQERRGILDIVSDFMIENPTSRKIGLGLQGISNSFVGKLGETALIAGSANNPLSAYYLSKALQNREKNPLTAKDATERAIEKGTEYGGDAAVIATTANLLGGAGLLGSGQSLASRAVLSALTGSVADATVAGTGAGMLTGLVNPDSWYGNLATSLIGGISASGLKNKVGRTVTDLIVGSSGKNLKNELSSVSSLSKSVNTPKDKNFISLLGDKDKTQDLKRAVSAGEEGISEKALSFLDRMERRAAGAIDDELESLLELPQMKDASQAYKDYIRTHGNDVLSQKAVKEFYQNHPVAKGMIDDARAVNPSKYNAIPQNSVREFDELKRMLRKQAGNQINSNVGVPRAEAAETAENFVKNLLETHAPGFKDVNTSYASAKTTQELFEKKMLKNLKELSNTKKKPFWSGVTVPISSAGLAAGAINPLSFLATAGLLTGKTGLRAYQRGVGRQMLEGKTVRDIIRSMGNNSVQKTKYPFTSYLINEQRKKKQSSPAEIYKNSLIEKLTQPD